MKQKKINELFNILIQFEKIGSSDSNVTENSYKNYLDRLYVWYVGYGNQEISNCLNGLYKLGSNIEHSVVKRTVFHMIDVVEKEMSEG